MDFGNNIINQIATCGIFSSAVINRLDWFDLGAGSISKTAALIMLMIIASWALCSIKNKFVFCFALLLDCLLGYFLIQTYSRGSLISLILAFTSFLILAPIKFSKLKITAVCIIVFTGIIYSNALNFSDRIANMIRLESSSANVRYDLYTAGLKMLTDAPNGFQEPDTPAKIYMKWYQRMYENEEYNTLVNSHLEFLNRYGITIKLLYILLWSFVFCITFSYKKSILSAVSFSVWLAFFTNSIFSNIATFWLLWTIPLLFLAISVWTNRERFLHTKFYIITFALFIFVSSVLFSLSYFLKRGIALKFDKNEIKIGNGNDNFIFIYSPNEDILGRKYGIEIIDAIKGKDVCITMGKRPNPNSTYKIIIISGSFDIKNILDSKSKKYIFLNPILSDRKEIVNFIKLNNTLFILGQMTDFANISLWRKIFYDLKSENLIILNNVGAYIPDWTSYMQIDK